MYNIVIFSGGTGSVALQEGIAEVYGVDNINLDIIINAYDNGKSTGACRAVFGGRILGPSDLRKNHLTQFSLQKAKALRDRSSRENSLYSLFECRISAKDKEEYYDKVCEILEKERGSVGDKDIYYLKSLLDCFFFEDMHNRIWRASLEKVSFEDFSIANIFYSASAAMSGYSLRLAGKDMAEFLGIKDNVHLISDVNVYLEAMTESGYVIHDEGDIVQWDNPNDKIKSVRLIRNGKEYIPSVDERTDITKVRSCKSILEEADIILFSSGTQWSSLIPSYMHSGLRKILSLSRAKKYLIMNNVEDHDMQGVSADEIADIIGQNIPLDDITAVVNVDAVKGMNSVSRIRSISGHIGSGLSRHNPEKLITLIMNDYFGIQDFTGTFIYDLDGTLWNERENNKGKAVGNENMNLFKGIIHSGNNYEHVRDVFKFLYHQDRVTEIYSDFGNIHFNSKDYTIHVLSQDYIVGSEVVEELEKEPVFSGKIRTRGMGSVVTIKPLVNREVHLRNVQEILKTFDGKYEARISGYTSIDITVKDYNKKTMMKEILKENNLRTDNVIFVGNETIDGAESTIKDLGIRTLQVDDVYECNILLKTLKRC